AAPPVPVQWIPPGDDGVALLARPETGRGSGPERATATPRGSLGTRLCLAFRRLPTCHLDQSSCCPRSRPPPYTLSGAWR
ncbi:hypothetical protein OFB92_29960, partial [Escherichia coli]|nr:hypothetical protein [Escherichia coli]